MIKLPPVGADFAQYRIDRELGRGGFATVFAATDRDTGERVALKVLHTDRGGSYERATVERFRREVAIVGALTNRYTVRLLASGEEPALWAAFELLAGRNLSSVLDEHGVLSAGATAHVLRQVLTALQEAHALGLVHRDLKPDNIRVFDGDEGALTVKLLDFGIARATVDRNDSVTRTGELIGTPRYMSPEQLTGRALTAASDIYSVGLIGFELLYGAHTLKGNSLYDQVERLQDPTMFTQRATSDEQARLTAVLQRMVQPNVDQRLGTAAAALAAMHAQPPVHVAAQTKPQTSRVLFGVGALALLVASGAIAYTGSEEPAIPPATDRVVSILASPEEVAAPEVASPQLAEPNAEVVGRKVPAVARKPSQCGSFDGPWPEDELYVYIPKGRDPNAAPFVFVALAEHWYHHDHLSTYLDYLQLREHADARGFPVVLASTHTIAEDREPDDKVRRRTRRIQRLLGHGVEHLLTDRIKRFYARCDLEVPAVLFGEASAAGYILPIAATSPVFFNAAVVSGIRARDDDYPTRTDPKIPLLVFSHTANKHAPWNGESVIYENATKTTRKITSTPPPDLHNNFRLHLNCVGEPKVATQAGCERQLCDVALEICIVEGGQWWSTVRSPKMSDVRFQEGGTVTGFPYHAVMWDFLDAALAQPE